MVLMELIKFFCNAHLSVRDLMNIMTQTKRKGKKERKKERKNGRKIEKKIRIIIEFSPIIKHLRNLIFSWRECILQLQKNQ